MATPAPRPELLGGRRAAGVPNCQVITRSAQAVRALGAGDLLADAPRILGPTIVAVGRQDVVTTPENARTAFGALSGGERLVEVPEVGQALPQEAPETVAALLDTLVARTA